MRESECMRESACVCAPISTLVIALEKDGAVVVFILEG